MQLMDIRSCGRHQRVRTRDTLAVNHTEDFSVLFQDELALRIFLQA